MNTEKYYYVVFGLMFFSFVSMMILIIFDFSPIFAFFGFLITLILLLIGHLILGYFKDFKFLQLRFRKFLQDSVNFIFGLVTFFGGLSLLFLFFKGSVPIWCFLIFIISLILLIITPKVSQPLELTKLDIVESFKERASKKSTVLEKGDFALEFLNDKNLNLYRLLKSKNFKIPEDF